MEMKRHLDCDWLIEKSPGLYRCCDVRSGMVGKDLNKDQAMQDACRFFHQTRQMNHSVEKQQNKKVFSYG